MQRICATYLLFRCAPALSRHCCAHQRPRPARRFPTHAAQARSMSERPKAAAGAPPAAAGAVLDKEQFKQQLTVRALRIPTKQCQQYMALLSKHLLNKPRLKNIQDIADDRDHKLLLLDEQLDEDALATHEVSRGGQSLTLVQLMEQDGLEAAQAQLEVDYSYWPASHVLQRILPPGSEVPSSFEAVGHIAHLNLREELLPWKYIIGQVILDKNPRLRTVVNKVGAIENEWRVFQMEVLASRDAAGAAQQQGEGGQGSAGSCMETEVRQHGARFKLDFSKVYWNSRLEHEHHRLVGIFQPGEVILDVMAGIGPFAVPAAQKGCVVWANDLNPDSFRWLRTNIALNKVGGRVVPFNLDGREAIRLAARGALPVAAAAAEAAAAAAAAGESKQGKSKAGGKQKDKGQQRQQQQEQGGQASEVSEEPVAAAAAAAASTAAAATAAGKPPQAAKEQQQQQQPEHPAMGGLFQHAVMNLPASAVEFVDAFRGAFDPEMWAGQPLPWVHVYTFCKGEEDTQGMQQRVEAALGGPLDAGPEFHLVRDVAPNKKMYCITFRVPASVAFAAAGEGRQAAAAQAGPSPGEEGRGVGQEGSPVVEGASGKRQKLA